MFLDWLLCLRHSLSNISHLILTITSTLGFHFTDELKRRGLGGCANLLFTKREPGIHMKSDWPPLDCLPHFHPALTSLLLIHENSFIVSYRPEPTKFWWHLETPTLTSATEQSCPFPPPLPPQLSSCASDQGCCFCLTTDSLSGTKLF